PSQRARQGRRRGVPRRAAAPLRLAALRQRPSVLRARPEDGRRRLSDPRRRRRALDARDRARSRSRRHALRLRPGRPPQRLHGAVADRGLTGILLAGGASTRFGSPKALARLDGETLAERGWRVLGEASDERLAVGKAPDALELPFDVLDDGIDVRAPIAGVIAGLRAAAHDVCVVLPVDTPLVTAETLRLLGHTVAVPQTGPLPGAYAKRMLPRLERRLARGTFSLRGINACVVELDERLLANANTARDLADLAEELG